MPLPRNFRAPRWPAVALIVGGLICLAWVAFKTLEPQPLPYERVLVEEVPPDRFPELGLEADSGVTVRRYEVRTEGIARPIVDFHLAYRRDLPPVPLSWQSHLNEPVLHSDADPLPVQDVARVMVEHLPEDAVVYAWWDTSRRLGLFEEIPTVYGASHVGPVFVPSVWQGQADAVREEERSFWGSSAGPPPTGSNGFARFVDALALDVHAGTAALREMADGKPAFIALSLSDAYKLGAMAPEKFGIGFKDFAKSSQSHGLIKGVKEWINDNGYGAYSVYPTHESVVRIFFLTDEVSQHTLLASLLPFDSSNPAQVPGTRLVYQHRGYWIYELLEGDAPRATAESDS